MTYSNCFTFNHNTNTYSTEASTLSAVLGNRAVTCPHCGESIKKSDLTKTLTMGDNEVGGWSYRCSKCGSGIVVFND